MVSNVMCRKFLRKYGYKTTEQGVQKILDSYAVNKAKLLEMFPKHPNWDEDAMAIVIKNVEFPKKFSREPLNNFKVWTGNTIPKLQLSKAIEDKSEIYYINKLDDIRAMIRYANRNNKKVEVDGKDVHDLQEDAQKEYEDFQTRTFELRKIKEDDEKSYFITDEFKQNIDKVYGALCYIKDYCNDSNITAGQASEINGYYNVNATEGQKLSRVINKLCTAIGLNEYRESQTTTNLEGEEITREVGYQHQFNVLAEAITSKTYKVHAVISINPIDYWGMSLIHKASSCQTIDCYNIENRSSSYSGQCSGGTTSFMLDGCTFVFYTVIETYDGNLYYIEEKMNRCLFSVSDNGTVLIQHRVYPDARDGGDQNKAKQYRNLVQDVIATIWENDNLWTFKGGSLEVRPWYRKTGLHYDDLSCNSDVNVSLLKNHNDDWKTIDIGARENICPVCGRRHQNSGNIMCYDCRNHYYDRSYANVDIFKIEQADFNIDDVEVPSYADFTVVNTSNNDEDKVVCAHCECEIDESTAICINGEFYCDNDCAEAEGWHYIEEYEDWYNENDSDLSQDYDDDTWHLTEDGYVDEYDNNWYYGDPEVEAEDGTKYWSTEHAIDNEYDQDENGNWYPRDEMLWNDRYGYRHHDECIEIDGEYYWDEDSAREAGFVEDLNDNWQKEEDCFYDDYHEGWCRYDDSEVVHINDRYYADEDSANDAGYVYHNGTWVDENSLEYDNLTDNYFSKDEAEVVTEDGTYFLYETSAINAGYRETENGWIHESDMEETA